MRLRLFYPLLFITLGVMNAFHGFQMVQEGTLLLSAADFILAAMWCYIAAFKLMGKK
jgi:hypothetical protein